MCPRTEDSTLQRTDWRRGDWFEFYGGRIQDGRRGRCRHRGTRIYTVSIEGSDVQWDDDECEPYRVDYAEGSAEFTIVDGDGNRIRFVLSET
jgi:hypothetical protein